MKKYRNLLLNLLLTLSTNICLLFGASFLSNRVAKQYEYYAQRIDSLFETNNYITIENEHADKSFILQNNFYVGYNLNYLYTSSNIKTYFKQGRSDNSATYNYLFCSNNTGVHKAETISYYLNGLRVIQGEEFVEKWEENECYISETMLKKYGYQNWSENLYIHYDNFDFLVRGVISDQTIRVLDDNIDNTLVVTFDFATHNVMSCSLITKFTAPDYAAAKRYLKFYLDHFSNEEFVLKTNNTAENMTLENKFSTEKIILPFAISFILCAAITIFLTIRKIIQISILDKFMLVTFVLVFYFSTLIKNKVFLLKNFLIFNETIFVLGLIVCLALTLLIKILKKKFLNSKRVTTIEI